MQLWAKRHLSRKLSLLMLPSTPFVPGMHMDGGQSRPAWQLPTCCWASRRLACRLRSRECTPLLQQKRLLCPSELVLQPGDNIAQLMFTSLSHSPACIHLSGSGCRFAILPLGNCVLFGMCLSRLHVLLSGDAV